MIVPASYLKLVVTLLVTGAMANKPYFRQSTPDQAPKVFVYENPAVDWSGLVDCYREKHGVSPWRDESDEHAQNMAEVWVHQGLLRHPMRTRDPGEASLFFLPLYVTISSDADPHLGSLLCGGQSHQERMDAALDFLEKESTHFSQYGGANHFFVCAWWRCGAALGDRARAVLSRTVLGIQESPPENNYWARWECVNRVVTVPYVSSSRIPTALFADEEEYTGRNRTTPFYFAGRARGRPERENLLGIKAVYPDSIIAVSSWEWNETPESYGEHISRSQFCLCPRGDTMTSRRLFDAVAAGCIPVVGRSQMSRGSVPFLDEIAYSELAVILPDASFTSVPNVKKFARALGGMGPAKILAKRRALLAARSRLVYGHSTGNDVGEMHHAGAATYALLREVQKLVKAPSTLWACEPIPWWQFPAQRVTAPIPPTEEDQDNWILGDATVLLRREKILACLPPFAAAAPMLRFFGEAGRGSRLLETYRDGQGDVRLKSKDMREVYLTVGWIKAAAIRDPVARILAAFLHENPEGNPSEFKELVRSILATADARSIPRAYRPQVSFCGMRHAHFDTLFLFEELARSKNVLESLPNNLWVTYGGSWTSAVEGGVENREGQLFGNGGDEETGNPGQPRCGKWAGFFDEDTLDMVASIYREDYEAFSWYRTGAWSALLESCPP